MKTKSTISSESSLSTRMLSTMVGIGLLCALLIAVVYEGTSSRIELLRAEALQAAIFKVLPGTVKVKPFQVNESGLFEGEGASTEPGLLIFAGYDHSGNLVGVAIEASGQGYADLIKVLYGYDPFKQAIIGMEVLETKETPGLGDKIEKDPEFLANFVSLDVSISNEGVLSNEIVTVKSGTKRHPWEIDGITGATISSRAIGSMLNQSANDWIPLIHKNADKLRFK